MVHNDIKMSDKYIDVIHQSKVFQDIEKKDIWLFLKTATTRTFTGGSNIVTEGDVGQSFFIILEGDVEIYKQDFETGGEYLFTTLQPGDEFGELALMIQKERSATVRAQGDVVVLEFSTDLLATGQPLQFMATYSILIKNIARGLARKLALTDDFVLQSMRSELELARTQSAMAEFIQFIIAVMTGFAFSSAILMSNSDNVAVVDAFSNISTGAALFVFLVFIYRSPYSFQDFGIRMPDNLWKHLLVSLGWSVVLIGLTILVKWLLIENVPVFNEFPLFFLPGQDYPGLEYAVSKLTFSLTAGYILLALVQEIMARGVMQGVLTKFYATWKYKHLLAILLSNALFAASHLHISLTFAVVTFFTGCLWGIQYVYQKSIIGVWISHAIVGLFGLRILGLVAMIRLLEG